MSLERLIDEFNKKYPPLDIEKIEIPYYIPHGKYLGVSRNKIVVIGDSLKEVTKKLLEKFPESATGVIRKGKDIEHFEVIYSLFSSANTNCFRQAGIMMKL